MLEITLATNNPKKARELRELLADLPVNVQPASSLDDPPQVVEDGDTFEANARKKAIAFQSRTGGWALADDSGLEVDALDGKPGVHSARFAGTDGDDVANNAKLLESLEGVPDDRRTARFRCVLCLRGPDGEEVLSRGSVEGVIGHTKRGTEGFGYDPLFTIPAENGRSFAELGAEYKKVHSHRGRALAALRDEIRAIVDRVTQN